VLVFPEYPGNQVKGNIPFFKEQGIIVPELIFDKNDGSRICQINKLTGIAGSICRKVAYIIGLAVILPALIS